MTVSKTSLPSHAEDWVHSLPRSFPTMRASPAKQFWEWAISTDESWLLIQPFAYNTRATATSCQAVCTAVREELGEARNSRECAPCCPTIAVSWCRDRPIAYRN